MVNDKEISLCIGWFCDMADACKQYACNRTAVELEQGEFELNKASAIDAIGASAGGRKVPTVGYVLFISDDSEKLSVLSSH